MKYLIFFIVLFSSTIVRRFGQIHLGTMHRVKVTIVRETKLIIHQDQGVCQSNLHLCIRNYLKRLNPSGKQRTSQYCDRKGHALG